MAKRGRKPSEAWNFFTLNEDKKHATCTACGLIRCKNVMTLESHLSKCEQLDEATRDAWKAAVQERKDLKASAPKRRRHTSSQRKRMHMFD